MDSKNKQLALSLGAVSVGFYTAHWLVFSEANRMNKTVAVLGGIATVMLLSPKDRANVATGITLGALAGYLSASV